MNLKQLKDYVEFEISNLREYQKPEDISVSINIAESSIGASASVPIKHINMGFDWEAGQIRITPTVELVRKGNSLSNIKPIFCESIDGRNYYWCPICQNKIAKDDMFCRYCGQRLK